MALNYDLNDRSCCLRHVVSAALKHISCQKALNQTALKNIHMQALMENMVLINGELGPLEQDFELS